MLLIIVFLCFLSVRSNQCAEFSLVKFCDGGRPNWGGNLFPLRSPTSRTLQVLRQNRERNFGPRRPILPLSQTWPRSRPKPGSSGEGSSLNDVTQFRIIFKHLSDLPHSHSLYKLTLYSVFTKARTFWKRVVLKWHHTMWDNFFDLDVTLLLKRYYILSSPNLWPSHTSDSDVIYGPPLKNNFSYTNF